PRGKYDLLQSRGHRDEPRRARIEDGERSVARADPEYRVRGGMQPGRRGLMLVLSSPSGAGKTTLARRLLEAERDVSMSVSCTTRRKRKGEVDGRDYHF